MPLTLVRKRISPELSALMKVVDKMQPVLRASLLNKLELFADSIDLKIIRDLYEAGDLAGIEQALDIGGLEAVMRPDAARIMTRTVELSAIESKKFFQAGIRQLIPRLSNVVAPFNIGNPRIARFITGQTGELITEIGKQTLASVRTFTGNAFNTGVPPRRFSKMFRGTIGLHSRQAQAVSNFRNNLEQGNFLKLTSFQRDAISPSVNFFDAIERPMGAGRVDFLTQRYADRQLKFRHDMIAETESAFAMNFGQQEVWEQGAEEGMFSRDLAQKVWVVVPDDKLDRKVCLHMEDVAVGLDELFDVPEVGPRLAPPAHPKCRCVLALEIGEEDTNGG